MVNLRTVLAAALAIAAAAPVAAQDTSGSVGVIAPTPKGGREVYQVVCQACHMADGKGGAGAGVIPGLAGNPRLAAPAYPIMLVVQGRGAMPWLGDMLSPAQIADVVGYIRTNFGNNYTAPVTEAEVKQLQAALAKR